MKNVDELAATIINLSDSDCAVDPNVPLADDDTFEKFLHERELAAAAGANGGTIAHAFEKQTALTDAQFSRRFSERFFQQTTPYEDTPDTPAEVAEVETETDAALLAKSATSAHARKIFNLRTWLKKSLAHGESLADLIANAEKYDADEAAAIREAAQGL
jgi:hypothetical protein